MNRKFKNVAEILDPHSKYVFLDDEGMTEAFLIRGVKENLILAQRTSPFEAKRRSGYFVAASGCGVIRFEAELGRFEKKEGLLSFQINPTSLKMVDRREFHRHHFKYPLPIYLKCEGKFIKAFLVNISEGGLRMTVNRQLPTQIVFNFELKLPRPQESLDFVTDGLIVYCEPEEDPAHFMTGVAFIAPEFSSEKERQAYQKARATLAHYIGKEKS